MSPIVPAPRINTNDDKVQVARWRVQPDSFVEAGKDVVDLETSKAVVTVTAERAGYVRPLVKEKAVVKVGAPLYLCAPTLDELSSVAISPVSSSAAPTIPFAPPSAQQAPGRRGTFSLTRFSKAALRLLAERGWSPDQFQGAGLVTARSFDRPTPSAGTTPADQPTLTAAPVVEPGPVTGNSVDVALSKQAEIKSLTIGESGNVNSMLSIWFNSAGVRKRIAADNAFNGNIQPIILFELSRLLKKWPQLTAYFHGDQIHYYDRVDLGLAVDLGKGLKVVTIPNADTLMPVNFHGLSVDIGLRYMRNKLKMEDLTGSTFTVSDLSSQNIMHFHPLINGYQSAIMGIGGDGSMDGHPMSINLTFDHRVTTGREVSKFLNDLRTRILSYAQADTPIVASAQ